MENLNRVIISPYCADWKSAFQELKSIYQKEFGEYIHQVEHVGSTAVPGLAAKPIIDIDIIVESAVNIPPVIKRLEKLGYIHIGDRGIKGRETFERRTSDVPLCSPPKQWPVHHLYLCTQGNIALKNHLILRDFLTANPSVANAYGELKKSWRPDFRMIWRVMLKERQNSF